MPLDPCNPVVALCAAGMCAEGDPERAALLFGEAWAARRDDVDAAIAAHFLARVQPTPADALHWNALAVRHAEAAPRDEVAGLLASLYLNLAESSWRTGGSAASRAALDLAQAALGELAPGGYRSFVEMGIRRLAERVAGGTA